MESSGIEVEFQYWHREGIGNRTFSAICQFVPRVGEVVVGEMEGAGYTVVRKVCYTFFKVDSADETFHQSVCVVLGDPTREEHERFLRRDDSD